MKWFRWYRGASENPKFAVVAALCDGDAPVTSLSVIVASWSVILEDACSDERWGYWKKDDLHLACVLRIPRKQAACILSAMKKVGLLEKDGHIAKWEEYQAISDDGAARQRKYREAHKNAKRDCHVTGNEMSRTKTKTKTETETKTKRKKSTPASLPAEQLTQFDQFYAAYPRKEARARALAAFPAALQKVDFDTLLAATKVYANRQHNEDPKFTALPASWLNGERWADAPPPKFSGKKVREAAEMEPWEYQTMIDEFDGQTH